MNRQEPFKETFASAKVVGREGSVAIRVCEPDLKKGFRPLRAPETLSLGPPHTRHATPSSEK